MREDHQIAAPRRSPFQGLKGGVFPWRETMDKNVFNSVESGMRVGFKYTR
ncbi:hypothetical protein J2129_002184 [Methanofollis sp. W23]|nr:hypothetical protein [Methanofollis sp. W23]